jgi:putative ABC transport system permease protein
MWKNYLLLFIRNLRRQRFFSMVNLLGLTVSISSALLIYLYIEHELSYDRFHPAADRIYRVNQTFIWGENDQNQFASTGPGVATAVRAELPEVELLTSIHTPGSQVLSYSHPSGEVISFEEEKTLAADTNFFQMFNFPLIRGEASRALRQANTLVLTASTARKYFGDDNPLGKLMRVGRADHQQTFEVTGVTADPPDNSYITYDVLMSMTSVPAVERLHWSWIWTQLETFVRLREHTDLENTRQKLEIIPRKYAEETLQRTMNTSYEAYIQSGKKWEIFLQPMTSIHLPESVVYNRLNDSGNRKVIYSLATAGVFIILLSCVNFMNLSTAQFTRRIKEASIRKILGLGKRDLGFNYFLEALLFCLLALGLGLALAQIFMPAFNLLTGKQLALQFIEHPSRALVMAGLVLLMAGISSVYPALFLSAFHPVEAMKGKLKAGREGQLFRKSLVVFQFSVSIILLVCTVVVYQQLQFVSTKDLGFTKDNLLVLEHVEFAKGAEQLTHASANVSGVVSASWCTSLPPDLWGGDKFTAEGIEETFSLNYTSADEQYLPTLNIQLLAGRNFSTSFPEDKNRVIVNEAMIRKLGWNPDETVTGKKILTPDRSLSFEIVGVVKDFNYWSLSNPIEPMAIFHIKNESLPGAGQKQFIVLKMTSQDGNEWEKSIASLGALWKAQAVDSPLEYSFVDQSFAQTFQSQQQFGTALAIMASLAILIASLGLLGMIIYMLEQRTKEIGIRKVAGASVWNIWVLISTGYTRLIIISFIISAPLAYFAMQNWLQDFAYRVELSPLLFVLTGLVVLLIALMITSYHSIKASMTNPVDVLKDE